jgi:hypothetical protein
MLPCVYALLSHKTESIYKQLLGFLKEGAIKFGLRLNPQIALTDFEIAAQNAYEFLFTGIRLIGCFFHFGQCVIKKIRAIGLITEYKEDDSFKLWVKSFIALGLIRANKVEEALESLLDNEPNLPRISE